MLCCLGKRWATHFTRRSQVLLPRRASHTDYIHKETGIMGGTARNATSIACRKGREYLSRDASDVKDPDTHLVHLPYRSFRRRRIHLVQDNQFLPELAYVVLDGAMTRHIQ
jgi:hypothetical protein